MVLPQPTRVLFVLLVYCLPLLQGETLAHWGHQHNLFTLDITTLKDFKRLTVKADREVRMVASIWPQFAALLLVDRTDHDKGVS
jgi:hypothetical protein